MKKTKSTWVKNTSEYTRHYSLLYVLLVDHARELGADLRAQDVINKYHDVDHYLPNLTEGLALSVSELADLVVRVMEACGFDVKPEKIL